MDTRDALMITFFIQLFLWAGCFFACARFQDIRWLLLAGPLEVWVPVGLYIVVKTMEMARRT